MHLSRREIESIEVVLNGPAYPAHQKLMVFGSSGHDVQNPVDEFHALVGFAEGEELVQGHVGAGAEFGLGGGHDSLR